MRYLFSDLSAMGPWRKRFVLIAFDVVALAFSIWAALSVRLGQVFFGLDREILVAGALSIVVGIFALERLGVYRIVLRFFHMRTVSRIFFGVAAAALAWSLAVYFGQMRMAYGQSIISVPRSIGPIYCGFAFVLLFMGRYAMGLIVSGSASAGQGPQAKPANVVIYGANSSAIALGESLASNPAFRLRCFVDDNPLLHRRLAAGRPIHSPDDLPRLVRSLGIDEVFLAIPEATRAQRFEAINRLTELKVGVKTLPSPEEIASGRYTVSDIRPIDVGDLLRRDPVQPLEGLVRDAVEGRSILVTGAGGSIGSEICRQIHQARPARLVLLDHSEFALFSIEQELLRAAAVMAEADRPELVPVVGSILDKSLLSELLATSGAEVIYHAAAYKHVPLLEQNEIAGISNNVFGTLMLAKAAVDHGVRRFIMVSTDKAVRPTSVMGATKRTAELIIQAMAGEQKGTRFGIVRFGNVLDSSGSVVQAFRRQIAEGGPITVTHRDVTRFFMSIPEATHLVLQAGAMATGGEVFVLDMGEPVRIAELAENMVRLSGLTVRDEQHPEGDIEVVYVGLRPGEKLYEELFIGESTQDTPHPRIRMAPERTVTLAGLEAALVELREAVAKRDCQMARDILMRLAADELAQPGKPFLVA